MKIIQVHNFYQNRGGEGTVVAAEKKLLEEKGHQVVSYYRDNDVIHSGSFMKRLALLKETTWSNQSYDAFLEVLEKEKPDLCHVHNFLPLISPSVFSACQKMDVPVVQTLHNYRLICANGLLQRKGQICEDCLGKSPYGAVFKKCYRNSMVQTYAVARMLEKNRQWSTWNDSVDAYICLTSFARKKFIAHGIPEGKLLIKPNFIQKPQKLNRVEHSNPYFVFVGRLSPSKGVLLLKEIAPKSPFPIWVVGEGELESELRNVANIKLVGKKTHTRTMEIMAAAKALLLPSLWYEGMPMTIIEAFSLNVPVITSKLGAMKSMIRHKENGLLFSPDNANDLLKNLNFVATENERVSSMTEKAFSDYQELYSPEGNYEQLIAIYSTLIQEKK